MNELRDVSKYSNRGSPKSTGVGRYLTETRSLERLTSPLGSDVAASAIDGNSKEYSAPANSVTATNTKIFIILFDVIVALCMNGGTPRRPFPEYYAGVKFTA